MNISIKGLIVPSLALFAAFGAASCSDEETLSADVSKVSEAPSFTDTRDGKTYRCIKVGDQIWTVDNLAYYPPEGAAAGCLTWDENSTDFTLDDLKIDTTGIVVEITDDKYKEIYTALANDPAHDWQAEAGVSKGMLITYINNFFDTYGQEQFTQMMAYYKPFYQQLLLQLEAYRTAQREQYIKDETERKARIPLDHRDKAEAENGNYSQTYGYLYSLPAALIAVPKEGGWRLPTDEDWKKLELALGMCSCEVDEINAWRGLDRSIGAAIKKGGAAKFDAIMGGCNAYQRTNEELYINQGDAAYFWASDTTTVQQEEEDEDAGTTEGGTTIVVYTRGIVRQVSIYSEGVWRGETRIDNKYRPVAYSVRLVRDAD